MKISRTKEAFFQIVERNGKQYRVPFTGRRIEEQGVTAYARRAVVTDREGREKEGRVWLLVHSSGAGIGSTLGYSTLNDAAADFEDRWAAYCARDSFRRYVETLPAPETLPEWSISVSVKKSFSAEMQEKYGASVSAKKTRYFIRVNYAGQACKDTRDGYPVTVDGLHGYLYKNGDAWGVDHVSGLAIVRAEKATRAEAVAAFAEVRPRITAEMLQKLEEDLPAVETLPDRATLIEEARKETDTRNAARRAAWEAEMQARKAAEEAAEETAAPAEEAAPTAEEAPEKAAEESAAPVEEAPEKAASTAEEAPENPVSAPVEVVEEKPQAPEKAAPVDASEKAASAAPGKFNLYERITDLIVDALQKKIIPWEKGWTGPGAMYSRGTRAPYSVLNQLLLQAQYGAPGEYATLREWNKLGGRIRKGEKSSIITFWKKNVRDVLDENGNPTFDEDGNRRTRVFPVLRYYNVFHVSQVVGVDPLKKPEVKIPETDLDALLQDYYTREGVEYIETAGDKAYYSPAADRIVLPRKEQFKSIEAYLSTKSHETVHSTSAKNRCNRDVEDIAAFGTENYAKEELVAEIGAAFLLGLYGMNSEHSERNTAAYCQSWARVLKNNPKWIIQAAGKAQKAVDYIMNK